MADILFMANVERHYSFFQKAYENNLAEDFPVARVESFLLDGSEVWDQSWAKRVSQAHFVIVPWMGTGLDTAFLKKLSIFMQQNKVKHIFLVEDAGDDLLSYGLTQEIEAKIKAYFGYSGIQNHENIQRWLSNEFCDKVCEYKEPEPLLWNGIYHPDADKVFTNLTEYQEKFCQSDRPTIGFVFYRNEWIAGELFFQDAVIRALEKNNLNVIAVFSNGMPNLQLGNKGLSGAFNEYFYKEQICVLDVLLSTLKFSLTTTQGLAFAEIQNLNIPILEAYTLYSSEKEWRESPEGVTQMEVSVGICMPEFDGVLHSVPIAVREKNELGSSYYSALPERIDVLATKAKKWAILRRKANKDKKIAIVFHNYPALNSNIGSAAGLDSPESVRLLLAKMREEGYDIDHIPEDSKVFMDELISNATNDRRYITEEQIKNAFGHLTTEQYNAFFQHLPKKTQEQLRKDWETEPGNIFLYDDALLIPGTLNGNVFITVQPPRGFGEDPSKLLHSPDCAPTHHYLGFYHWIRDIWQADAVMHIGTHGSLEWLPGKAAAFSDECYPDICIYDMPNIYPYWITIVGEGIQAKRRSAACLISYLTPPMSHSDVYDELEELEKTLDEYAHFKSGGELELDTLKDLVREKAKNANLDEDIAESEQEDFDAYVGRLHAYVTDIKNMQIRTGLHVLGDPPDDEQMKEYIAAITRMDNGDIPSLTKTIAATYGFDYYDLLENSFKKTSDGRLYSHIIEEIRQKSFDLIELLSQGDYEYAQSDKILSLAWIKESSEEDQQNLLIVARYICSTLVPNLRLTTLEISNSIRALEGEYIDPSAAGAPTSGGGDLLPTGRNFYGVDPRTLPTQAAWELGKQLGDQAIERFILEEGGYPENIGIILWAGANMRSHGQCIAEFLYLMGLKPVWQAGSMRVIDIEVIPLEELKRPRIDVTGRISGLFRDSMPCAVSWLDKAVGLVAQLDEDIQMNFIRKHILADSAELEASGVDKETAWIQASYRIFGDPPGAYGAGVGDLLEAKTWETVQDLADVYTRFSAHAYGEKGKGAYQPALFKKRMSQIDLTIKNEDNRESHMLSSDDFNAYHGGMIATVRACKGSAPRSYCGDTSDRSKAISRSLQEETKRIFRGEAINPKFIEGMQKHGYKGAQDLANYVAHCFQWDATSEVMDDWMYDKFAEKYALDKTMQEWMRDVNPWAMQRLTEVLLEASQRGMWNVNDQTKQDLENLLLSIEGDIEEAV